MFGLGVSELVVIAVLALLIVGPDGLPNAAKTIGKGIRDLRKQKEDLQDTIEKDTQIGDAMRELRSAMRGDPEAPPNKSYIDTHESHAEHHDAHHAEHAHHRDDGHHAEHHDAHHAEHKDPSAAAHPNAHDDASHLATSDEPHEEQDKVKLVANPSAVPRDSDEPA